MEHRNKREQQILNVLQNNSMNALSEDQLVKIIYIDTPEKLLKAAAYNVNHHLIKLLKENRVKQTKNGLWQHKDYCKHIM